MSASQATLKSAALQLLAVTARDWGVRQSLRHTRNRFNGSASVKVGGSARPARQAEVKAIALVPVHTGCLPAATVFRVFGGWSRSQDSFC